MLNRIIKTLLVSYLELHKLLSKNQFGFRTRFNSQNTLYTVTRFISNIFDNSEKTSAFFLNSAKTFDTINHAELINNFIKFWNKKKIV